LAASSQETGRSSLPRNRVCIAILLIVGCILNSDFIAIGQGRQIELNIVIAFWQILEKIFPIAVGDNWGNGIAVQVDHGWTIPIEERDSHAFNAWFISILNTVAIGIFPDTVTDDDRWNREDTQVET